MSDENGKAKLTAGPLRRAVHRAGNALVESCHLLARFAIGGATVWAAGSAFPATARTGASIEGLLLRFAYARYPGGRTEIESDSLDDPEETPRPADLGYCPTSA